MLRTLAITATLVFATPVLAEPVFVLAGSNVTDPDTFFNQYGPEAFASLQEHGATIYFGAGAHRAIEGDWEKNWTALVSFPDEAALEAWYNSDAYTAARQKRFAASEDGILIQFKPAGAE